VRRLLTAVHIPTGQVLEVNDYSDTTILEDLQKLLIPSTQFNAVTITSGEDEEFPLGPLIDKYYFIPYFI
jgi:hypothetical protein